MVVTVRRFVMLRSLVVESTSLLESGSFLDTSNTADSDPSSMLDATADSDKKAVDSSKESTSLADRWKTLTNEANEYGEWEKTRGINLNLDEFRADVEADEGVSAKKRHQQQTAEENDKIIENFENVEDPETKKKDAEAERAYETFAKSIDTQLGKSLESETPDGPDGKNSLLSDDDDSNQLSFADGSFADGMDWLDHPEKVKASRKSLNHSHKKIGRSSGSSDVEKRQKKSLNKKQRDNAELTKREKALERQEAIRERAAAIDARDGDNDALRAMSFLEVESGVDKVTDVTGLAEKECMTLMRVQLAESQGTNFPKEDEFEKTCPALFAKQKEFVIKCALQAGFSDFLPQPNYSSSYVKQITALLGGSVGKKTAYAVHGKVGKKSLADAQKSLADQAADVRAKAESDEEKESEIDTTEPKGLSHSLDRVQKQQKEEEKKTTAKSLVHSEGTSFIEIKPDADNVNLSSVSYDTNGGLELDGSVTRLNQEELDSNQAYHEKVADLKQAITEKQAVAAKKHQEIEDKEQMVRDMIQNDRFKIKKAASKEEAEANEKYEEALEKNNRSKTRAFLHMEHLYKQIFKSYMSGKSFSPETRAEVESFMLMHHCENQNESEDHVVEGGADEKPKLLRRNLQEEP